MNKLIVGGVIAATFLLIFGGAFWTSKNSAEQQARLAQEPLGEKIEILNSKHVPRGAAHAPYNSEPPTSGEHWAGVAGPGIKTEQAPDELVLHSMEHGAAVVWYSADLPESEIEKIRSAFSKAAGKKIMSPRAGLDVPVALASWGYLLKLEEIDELQIVQFIEINNDRGPEKATI